MQRVIAMCRRSQLAAWTTQQGAPVAIENVVVDLVDSNRARQAGQIEALAVAVDIWLSAPLATLRTAVDLHPPRILRSEHVRL